MKLPDTSKNSQKGQILIVFLLVLVVGLAIALSIASRSVTDVRQTTTSDESNRAYFAAEAGIDEALKRIEDNTVIIGTPQKLDLTQTNRSLADVTVKNLSIDGGVVFEYPTFVEKDDVAQINLMSDFNNIATAGVTDPLTNKGVTRNDTLEFYFDDAAIEVSIVTCEAASGACTISGPTPSKFNIYKMVFDPSSISGGTFCTDSSFGGPVTTNQGRQVNYNRKVRLQLNSNFNCTGNDLVPINQNPVLARVRALYRGTKLGVSSPHLPNQGYEIESLGKVGSGVARKLKVYRLYPALPAIFDYVLYNGSTTNPLSK